MRRSSLAALSVSLLVSFFAACGGNGSSSSQSSAHGGAGGGGLGGQSSGSNAGGAGNQSSSNSSSSVVSSSSSGGAGGMMSSSSGMPCPSGTIMCMGNIEQVCDGMGGTKDTDCAASGKICVPDLGCLVCVPGTGSCNGNTGTYCLGDGSGYGNETCDPVQGTTCNGMTGHCDGACSAISLGTSYIGCDYYPTVTANIVATNFHFAVAVSNTTANDATVTITQGPNTITTVTVAKNSVQVVQLPWQLALKGPASNQVVPFPTSVNVVSGAYRLRSTQPVTVYQFSPLEYTDGVNFSYTNDASLLLPVNAWTGTYRVMARHHFYTTSGFYAVTAKDNNTKITVTAGPNGGTVKTGIPGIGANGNGTVTINAGDVIEVVTNGANAANDPDDVTGTLVQADHPVQVISGHQCTYIPDNTGYCDHLEESMFPYETLANDYLVTAPLIPTGGQTPKVEMVRIVATQANTTLTYDPPQPGAPTAISQPGAWIEIANNAGDFQVSGDKPILVGQYMEGQDAGGGSGDPAMALVVTKSQYRSSYLFHAPTNYSTSYLNIIAPTGVAVTLDGAVVPANAFKAIGGTGYSVARQPLSNAGSGNHVASAPMPFGVTVYGYGQYTSYWYPGGSDLAILHQ